ncbi:MAG: dihydrolipoyl dehydrogenase [Acidobacteriota bacterium]|jgi:dihydrolipoamide dehydrogenase
MAEQEFDLIVIGSGPGGYVAAIRAGQLGMKVAVVEKDSRYGGTCLLRGCIPTKQLLHTADLLEQIREAGEQGIEVGQPRVDIDRTMDRKEQVVSKNAKGVEFLFKKNKVRGIHGTGRLAGPNAVEVESPEGEKTTYRAQHVLIATGSVPRDVPPAPVDGETIITSDHVLEMREIPESMVVLGAGAVGTEFASIYRSFGTEITLVEMLPRVLPGEDEEVSKELERNLRKRGMTLKTGTKLASAETTGSGVRVTLEGDKGEETVEASKLLVAVGRAPVSRDLGFEEAGVEIDDRGYLEVDETMRTTADGVYAIGDVVDTPWLAHVASAEGILAVEHMAGRTVRPLRYDHVPMVTFCEPEVAHVGLTEAEAKERGYDVATGKFPFTALGKAVIAGKTAGFVKIVRDTKYDEVLGVHIIGVHATDLIAEACAALHLETTNQELIETIHAHPTLGEAVHEAAHAAAGHAIHI